MTTTTPGADAMSELEQKLRDPSSDYERRTYQALMAGTATPEQQRAAAAGIALSNGMKWEAGLRINTIEAQNRRYAEALRPFLTIANHCAYEPDETVLYIHQGVMGDYPLTIGDFRALKALNPIGGSSNG